MSTPIAAEFPDFDRATLPPIPPGFVDSSWHNDACPSFHDAARKLTIWVDYVDLDMREFPENEGRFQLVTTDASGATLKSLATSDDWSEIETAIAARQQATADTALLIDALAIAEAETRAQATAPGMLDTDAGNALIDKADAFDALRQQLLFD